MNLKENVARNIKNILQLYSHTPETCKPGIRTTKLNCRRSTKPSLPGTPMLRENKRKSRKELKRNVCDALWPRMKKVTENLLIKRKTNVLLSCLVRLMNILTS